MYCIGRRPASDQYAPISSQDLKQESQEAHDIGSSHLHEAFEPLEGPSRFTTRACTKAVFLAPWLMTVLFAILSTILFVRLQEQTSLGTYETNFETDFLTVFPSQVPLQQIRFRGTPHFYNNGSPWADLPDKAASWPENVQYVGEPSSEVDSNWRRLIGERYFSLSDQDAQRAWGERRYEYVDQNAGGYTAGFDMFHTLHCINEIRKALRPDYYFPNTQTSDHASFHNDHCIEILRQTVQCYGSTTLIPTRYIDGIEHNYIDSDQTHVCRSFQFIRAYANSRARGAAGYVPRDQSLVDEGKRALAKAWGAKYGDNDKSGAS